MKHLNKFCFVLMFIVLSINTYSQIDSNLKLSFNNYLQIVKHNHPLVKQADIITKSAAANTLMSRGSFDPKLFYEFNNKFFENKNYYELQNAGLKIPTWYGIEIKTGFEQNMGMYLNPENTTPVQGLSYAQISVPLLQGLIIDERRSTLLQARIFEQQSNFDKILTVNEILYKAGKAYWEWQLAYSNLSIFENAVKLSQIRFDAIKKTSSLGDRASIDTVEASIQLQDRILSYQQAQIEYRTKSLLLSNFLWLDNNTPVEITENTIPDNSSVPDQEYYSNITGIDSFINNHPTLKAYNLKLKQLEIEKKFKQDKLKPNLNVNYNPLFNNNNLNSTYTSNYKWGVSLGFPIFLRKERADLRQTKLKLENTSYEISNKRNEITNKIKATINEYNIYKNQVNFYRTNVLNYERLWQSEKRLFDSGESSLFMINSRELSYINAQIKLNEILNKNRKSALDIEYSYGILSNIY